MDWSIVAILAASAIAHLFGAAAWVVVGGLGGQWRVNQALSRQALELAALDERLTHDQKVRAGRTRQEGAKEAKSLELQAAEHLAAAPPVRQRPSTIKAINGGPVASN